MIERTLLEWRVEPAPALALACTAALYVWGARRARRWPARRTAAFLAGLALLAMALLSGLHSYGEQRLPVHMVQHLLLTLVVPPLLLAGAPASLALRSLPSAGGRSLARLAVLAHPAVGWAALSAVLVGTHAPGFYGAAVEHPLVHDAQHLLYLAAGLLFWLPLVGAEPLPAASSPIARVLALLGAMPPMALVGVWLMNSGRWVYPAYAHGALSDQRAAGAIMWVGGTAILAAATFAIGWPAMRREEERQRLREAYADRAGAPR